MNQHKVKAVRRQVKKQQTEIIRQFFATTLDMPVGDRAVIALDIATKGRRWVAAWGLFAIVAASSALGAALSYWL